MSNEKDITILLIAGLIKRILSQYFPPYRSFGGNIKAELDLSKMDEIDIE